MEHGDVRRGSGTSPYSARIQAGSGRRQEWRFDASDSRKVKVEPDPGVLFTSTLPPCRSAMRCTEVRLRPVPLPASLVVKKGLKT